MVDDDIEAAELGERLLDELPAEFLLADIAGQRQTAPPGLLDQPFRLGRIGMLLQVGDDQIRPFAGEGDGHRAADAAVAAGEDRDLIGQLAAAAIALFAGLRLRLHFAAGAGLMFLMLRRLFFFGHEGPLPFRGSVAL